MENINLTHSFSSIKMYENCPKRYYHQRITKEVQDTGSDATIYGERVHEALEHRLDKKVELPTESETYEPLCKSIEGLGGTLQVEQKLTLSENLTPTTWWEKDAWLRSILDVLIVFEDEAIVMDWKTGKRRPDFSQLEMFALQVFSHYPNIKKVKSTFVWLKDLSLDSHTYNRLDADDMWVKLLSKTERINQSLTNNNWPPKPSGLCRFCPAKNICEFSLN